MLTSNTKNFNLKFMTQTQDRMQTLKTVMWGLPGKMVEYKDPKLTSPCPKDTTREHPHHCK